MTTVAAGDRIQQTNAQTMGSDAAWEALIAEQADAVEPAGYLRTGDVLARGDGPESAAPMRVSDLRFKGYVPIWDTKTGQPGLTPWWLLWQVMPMKHDDGTPMYTRTDPKIAPDYGADLFCPLNPNAPAEQRFTGGGFKPCRKRHIPTEDAQLKHFQSKHNRAYLAYERQRAAKERAEDRALQQRMIESQEAAMRAMAARLGGAPDAVTTAGAGDAVEKPTITLYCPQCQEAFTSTIRMAAQNKLDGHMRREHPATAGETDES